MVLLPKDTRYLFHILYGSGEEALLFHFGKLSHSAVSCSVQFFGFRKAAFPRFISFLIVRSLRPPRRAAISFTFTLACKSISSFCRSFGLLTVFLPIHIVAGFSLWSYPFPWWTLNCTTYQLGSTPIIVTRFINLWRIFIQRCT